jgi:serine/threonine protein kinase
MSTVLTTLTVALANRYRIEREIGHGGMATVYLAEDLKHGRKVAVKALRPDVAASLGAERFLQEIHIAAQLYHPNILALIDSGAGAPEDGGDEILYYVMPFIDGESLRAKLAREGELPVTESVRILAEVVAALAYAHEHGVVHRDIKPENVLLAGRHAFVADFGVAKAVSAAGNAEPLTQAGMIVGTATYMAPEQASGDSHVDHRADIYALGVLAYELLAGAPPFGGQTVQQILAAHVTRKPEPLSALRDSVPRSWSVSLCDASPNDRRIASRLRPSS